MNNILCPLCKSIEIRDKLASSDIRFKESYIYVYYECLKCGLWYLTNPHSQKEFRNIYGKKYYPQRSIIHNLLEACYRRYTFNLKIKLIATNISSPKARLNILDVGCGDGMFLRSLNKNIYNLYGIDRGTQTEIDGAVIFKGDISQVKFNKKFDIVTLWHVIEHLDDPYAIINKLKNLLVPNGVLLLSTPNSKSFGFKYAREKWFHLDAPRHTQIFNEKSLKYLFENAGLSLQKTKPLNFEFPFDLLYSIRSKNLLLGLLCLPIYPILKIISKETIAVVATNK